MYVLVYIFFLYIYISHFLFTVPVTLGWVTLKRKGGLFSSEGSRAWHQFCLALERLLGGWCHGGEVDEKGNVMLLSSESEREFQGLGSKSICFG